MDPNMTSKINPLAWLAVALVVAIGLMATLGSWAMGTYGANYGMMGSGGWGWGVVMMAVPAIFLIVVLLAALGGLSEPPASPAQAWSPASPFEVLEQRYARGELTREDFLRIRDDLSRGPNDS